MTILTLVYSHFTAVDSYMHAFVQYAHLRTPTNAHLHLEDTCLHTTVQLVTLRIHGH